MAVLLVAEESMTLYGEPNVPCSPYRVLNRGDQFNCVGYKKVGGVWIKSSASTWASVPRDCMFNDVQPAGMPLVRAAWGSIHPGTVNSTNTWAYHYLTAL
jgi:hypothetical protein